MERKEINKSIERDIAKAKKKLIRRAVRKGELWENFGDVEVGKLSDKYGDYLYNCEVDTDQIGDFQRWCWDYDLRSLRKDKSKAV